MEKDILTDYEKDVIKEFKRVINETGYDDDFVFDSITKKENAIRIEKKNNCWIVSNIREKLVLGTARWVDVYDAVLCAINSTYRGYEELIAAFPEKDHFEEKEMKRTLNVEN